ncbi:MAG: hypothetical protein K8R59_03350 [Thermoanaerobaculales bacterium]|nr:hypothetical protein [Thermoanaerobaculales bacterium]
MATLSIRAAGRLALARAGLLKPEWTGLPQRAGETSPNQPAKRIVEAGGTPASTIRRHSGHVSGADGHRTCRRQNPRVKHGGQDE